MVCFVSVRVATESDRWIDLSQRVFSTRCERSICASLLSLMGSLWMVPAIRGDQYHLCSRCGGGSELGSEIYTEYKVAGKFFAF